MVATKVTSNNLALIHIVILITACLLCGSTYALTWPQQIEADEGTIVIYQPQPEKLSGNALSGRAAMSLEMKGKEEPVFGTFWFDAKIDTDKDANTATIHDLKVTNVRWPDSKDAGEQRFTTIVEQAVPKTGFETSLDALTASLATAEVEQKSLQELNNKAPVIIFKEELAVLLLYDGDPKFSPIGKSDYERVLNTPFAVARSKKSKQLYLSNGAFWYTAKDPMGPWSVTQSAPKDLVAMMPKDDKQDDQTAAKPDPSAKPPAIVTAKEPTELIVTQGKADWQSLAGGKLLYVNNTESPWVRDLSTNNEYVLLSGRWFRAKSEKGPWTFVPSNELPASFKEIPPDSPIGGLRTSVAGTEEAEDAVLDSQVPQTAAIQRDKATFSVEYDGKPDFEKISGTKVSYAVNTGAQVLMIDKVYFAVDNGVWFTSKSATGPWAVATEIPSEEISKIPPDSPVYNVTFVEIYESTPEVVYVGYTPGYMWSFPYYGAPVYGTGWYYPPYWGGGFYYPRPPTWGFHVGYNPWTGWNFGVSWSNGFIHMGIGWNAGFHGPYRPWGCCGGWYGGGYHGHSGPTIINTGNINIGNNVNIGNSTKFTNAKTNLYNRGDNIKRKADPGKAMSNLKQARPLPKRENNVFSDKDGNVARQVGDKWESRDQGKWNAAGLSKDSIPAGTKDKVQNAANNRPATSGGNLGGGSDRPSIDRGNISGTGSNINRENLNRDSFNSARSNRGGFDRSGYNQASQARQRGSMRQMSRPAMTRPMGGGRR